MNLDFDEGQQMLRAAAREFLQAECPIKLVREAEDDPTGFAPELWRQMADLGWLGLPFPEQYGGSGGNFLDVVALIEELGRALAPVPYLSTVVAVGMAIATHGSEAQKARYLPRIARGELIAALALTEPEASYSPGAIQLPARPANGGHVLDGTKLFVQDGAIADLYLVVARTSAGADPSQGISLWLVEAGQPGIEREALPTFGEDRQAEVTFRNVAVPADARLGPLDGGWPIVHDILNRTIAAQCLEVVGMTQVAFDMALNYAKERVQFGQPIGSFQAIQHKCANLVIDVDGARFIAYQAAWQVNEGLPADLQVAEAKVWLNEAGRRVAADAHQIHGGIGFTQEYDLQLYTRRIKGAEARYGDTEYHRELVAQQLGL